LYLAFEAIGGVVHSHSAAATAWAQAGRDLPALGTTHADYFHGPVPCTRMIRAEEISAGYETATGQVIAERFAAGKIDPVAVPAVLVAGHGPFAWGDNADDAVHHAEVLEYVSDLAIRTLAIQSSPPPFPQTLLDKHFLRKHGPGAYYGQESGD
jgi:L-ribulose-5-phosphate 4-epimerase